MTNQCAELDFKKSFSKLIDTLSVNERKVLKSKLSKSVPLYFGSDNHLCFSEKLTKDNFDRLSYILRILSPNGINIPKNGIVYKGFPSWVTDDLTLSLQNEASCRRHEPLDRIDHFLGCGGDIADALAVRKEVVEFVEKNVGINVIPTGISSYLYYDSPGLGIKPHVDTDVFSINLMLMLKHDCSDCCEPSATLVFPEDRDTEYHRLRVGQVMIMYGGSVIHSRSIIEKDENVTLLTIGFNQAYS